MTDAVRAGISGARHYAVFGGRLASMLPLPELRPLDDSAADCDWTLDVVDGAPPALDAPRLEGEESLDTGATLRLLRTPALSRLEYEDTGAYDVSHDGRRITWYRVPGADARLVRADVLGRVLALALRARETETLHASAVVLGRGAIAFVAPRGHGKSSLATALVRAGATLLTDDTLAVRTGAPPLALPGVGTLRLAADSASALRDALPTVPAAAAPGVKQAIRLEHMATEGVPLLGVYEVAPRVAAAGAAPVTRERQPAFVGAMTLLRHSRLGALLRGDEAASMLRRLAAIAEGAPVHRLHVCAGLERLPEVAGCIADWHREAAR